MKDNLKEILSFKKKKRDFTIYKNGLVTINDFFVAISPEL